MNQNDEVCQLKADQCGFTLQELCLAVKLKFNQTKRHLILVFGFLLA